MTCVQYSGLMKSLHKDIPFRATTRLHPATKHCMQLGLAEPKLVLLGNVLIFRLHDGGIRKVTNKHIYIAHNVQVLVAHNKIKSSFVLLHNHIKNPHKQMTYI